MKIWNNKFIEQSDSKNVQSTIYLIEGSKSQENKLYIKGFKSTLSWFLILILSNAWIGIKMSSVEIQFISIETMSVYRYRGHTHTQ